MAEKESVLYRKNDAIPVREINKKSGSDSRIVGSRIAGVPGLDGKIYQAVPRRSAPPMGLAAVDNDLALENLEDHWDITMADRQDLKGRR